MHLLLVEDDEAIAEPLVVGLRRRGYQMSHAASGQSGLAAFEAGGVDLVLLDLNLPDLDGHEVCRLLRQRSDVPIIVLSACAEELDKVMVLQSGADDYVVKPFLFRELVARIEAVSRRARSVAFRAGEAQSASPPAPPPPEHSAAWKADRDLQVRQFASLRLDPLGRRVNVDDREVALTRKEFDLLERLTSAPGIVFSRTSLLESVWDIGWLGSTRTLDVHIVALRHKLGDPAWIETVRGVGYRFDPKG